MGMLVNIVVFCTVVVACQAATTTTTKAPVPTKEPNEVEYFRFYYNAKTHNMVVNFGHNCYVATLNPNELSNIHTDPGMKTVEKRLINMLNFAKATTQAALNHDDARHCTHHTGVTNYFTI